jgi:peptidoglycan pentaglycine glycine transferase (the first glycine)
MPELTAAQWDDFVIQFPNAHLLQSTAWGELKARFGWQVVRLAVSRDSPAGAQVLLRRLPLGFSIAYIPKGPLGNLGESRLPGWENLCSEIDCLCRERRTVFLKIEPDLWEKSTVSDGSIDGAVVIESNREPDGFRLGEQSIQLPRTLLVDLRGEEELVLGRMKQKARYNIRLASKKGVVASASSDLETFHRLMLATGRRDAFGVHSLEYYQRAYELFHPTGECELFIANFEGEPVAALMAFAHGLRSWYFYGASSDKRRELMPTYLLQWEAMRWARKCGCLSYDLWGVPDVDDTVLEAGFQQASRGLWGVYRFKRAFGGQLFRAPGPWDRVYRPVLYTLFRMVSKLGVRS